MALRWGHPPKTVHRCEYRHAESLSALRRSLLFDADGTTSYTSITPIMIAFQEKREAHWRIQSWVTKRR